MKITQTLRKSIVVRTLYYLLFEHLLITNKESYWQISSRKNKIIGSNLNDILGHCIVIWNRGIYDKFPISKDNVVLDIGAHVGIYAVAAARQASLVIAIEPDHSNFTYLLQNIVANKLSNVLPLQYAVGNEYNKDKALYLGKNTVSHSLISTGSSSISVTCETVDRLLKFAVPYLDRVDIVKINVEGAALEVLEGMAETIKGYKPKLMIPCEHSEDESKQVIDYLNRHNYQIEVNSGVVYAW